MIWAIHGFTGSPSMWETLSLVPASQCLTVLGHGPSSVAQGSETFDMEAQRLAALLPSPCPHLVGYSLGARLAIAIAIAHPSRIQKLTCIGVNPGIESATDREARLKKDQDWIRLLRTKGIEAFVEAWRALPLWDSQAQLSEAVLRKQDEQRRQHKAEQLALAMQALSTGLMPSMWDRLETLPMPVQLVVGAKDKKFSAIAHSMQTRIAKCEVREIEDAGHNPILEAPQQLADLLSRVPTPKVAAR